MNPIRKSVALLLAALLLLAMLPATGLAASYRIEALKLNQWYALHESSSTMPVYKLKVTSETIVAFSWKNVKSNGYTSFIEVYRDKACKDSIDVRDITTTGSGSDAFVLYSGTYYITMYDDNETGKIKITTKKAASVNKANYCISKALALKSGKKTEIAKTKKINYDRWYRINLTKKQTISFYGIEDYDFLLYDKNMNNIKCSGSNNKCVTVGKQPKGTYYLQVCSSYYSDLTRNGEYLAFYWK